MTPGTRSPSALRVVGAIALASCLAGCLALFNFDPYDTSLSPDGGPGGGGDGGTVDTGTIIISPDGAVPFSMTADPTTVALHVGDTAKIMVTAVRALGFAAPIDITFSSPTGLTVTRGAESPDHLELDLTGAAETPTTTLSIVGTSGNASAHADVHVTVYPPPGSLDRTFGDGGVVRLSETAWSMAFDPSARLVLGEEYGANTTLRRYLLDAGPDPAFGDAGPRSMGGDLYTAPTFDGTGRITSWSLADNGPSTAADVVALRFHDDGTADRTQDGGFVDLPGPVHDYATPIAAAVSDVSGRYVLARTSVVHSTTDQCPCALGASRFLANGAPDPSFTFDAGAALSASLAASILPLPSGGLLIAGERLDTALVRPESFLLMQVQANGLLDPSFGDGGSTETLVASTGTAACVERTIMSGDAGVLVAGYSTGGIWCDARLYPNHRGPLAPPIHVNLARITAAGQLDPSFGDGGAVAFTGWNGYGLSVALQPDGKILVGGSIINVSQQALVARLMPDGSVDPTFATGGALTLALPAVVVRDVVYANGMIFAAGTSADDSVFLAKIIP